MLRGERTSYIQTTLAVNRNQDVLVGFQDTNERMFISPRLAFRRAGDPAGTLREIVRLGEGRGATEGVTWGEYIGSVVDDDDLLDLWTIQSVANEQGRGDGDRPRAVRRDVEVTAAYRGWFQRRYGSSSRFTSASRSASRSARRAGGIVRPCTPHFGTTGALASPGMLVARGGSPTRWVTRGVPPVAVEPPRRAEALGDGAPSRTDRRPGSTGRPSVSGSAHLVGPLQVAFAVVGRDRPADGRRPA
jgi:hypothetical protein